MRKRATATICVNFSSFYFPFFLLFISHLIKKTGQKTALGMLVIPFLSEGVFNSTMCPHIKVAELNTTSDGNGAYHH